MQQTTLLPSQGWALLDNKPKQLISWHETGQQRWRPGWGALCPPSGLSGDPRAGAKLEHWQAG